MPSLSALLKQDFVLFSVFIPNNFPFFLLFAKFCYTKCFTTMPSSFALMFVVCFIRVCLLEIIWPEGLLVRVPEQVIH